MIENGKIPHPRNHRSKNSDYNGCIVDRCDPLVMQMATSFFILCFFVVFDEKFVQTLLDIEETEWQKLDDQTIPPEQDLETLAKLADRLAHWVPQSFLKKNLSETSLPIRGTATLLQGDVVLVKQYDALYHCTIKLQNETIAEVFTSSIPKVWKRETPIRERAAAFGVHVKTYNQIPIYAAPAMQWYPDTWLGNLGFNVASFDQVPIGRVTELEQHDEETNRRMFKFTESDREPFYGLLRVISAAPAGGIEEEAAKLQEKTPLDIADLFNRPQETRGKPVFLKGTVKRVVPTPVTDSEVVALFGIHHYYQLYLFPEQSQGNPLVICVCSLPEGMPVGETADFSETISVAAVPYKLWIYETREKPHYAPVLIAQSVTWHPQSVVQQHIPESFTFFSFSVFFALVLFWFACRLWRR